MSSLYFFSLALLPFVSAYCPPKGPTLPLALSLSENEAVKEAVSSIESKLSQYAIVLGNDTAITVTIGTINDDDPLVEYHNTPTVFNSSGSEHLTTDTQFIAASVSKLFTAYGVKLLQDKINVHTPVTHYIPELLQLSSVAAVEDAVATTMWSTITIEALLTHMAGIAEDLGDSDLDNEPGNFTDLGLPPLNSSQQGPKCGGDLYPEERPCSITDFFAYWGRKYPVYAPFTTPVYSNIGYALLGTVIERATGVSFAEYMQQAIFQPLSLEHTSVDHPLNLNSTFITAQQGPGDISEGFLASSSAIYTSSRDLYLLGRSILNSSLLLPAQTRAWLTPRTFTSSPSVFVGEAWEIARGFNLTTGDGHIVDVYTKGGNLNLYSSIIALVPDYGLIFSLMSAGSNASEEITEVILTQVLQTLIPAIDSANKAEAKARYAGLYKSGNNIITLSVDEGPGLLVESMNINGVNNVVGNVGQQMGASNAMITTLRLYPTNLSAGNRTAWQGVYETLSPAQSEQSNSQLFFQDGSCETWSVISLTSWGLRPLDQFIFTAGQDGRNVQIDARAWRSVMSRL